MADSTAGTELSGDAEAGDGDGDAGDGDGDGDAEPGDGDGEPGDGDGDGEPGDGDGEPANQLPSCPTTTSLSLPVVKDTFLAGSPSENGTCIVSLDLETHAPLFADSQVECAGLDFGGADFHWVCGGDGCNSSWLGRFNVGGWADQAPKVTSAKLEFNTLIDNTLANLVSVVALDVDPSVFGQCGDWNPGPGWGDPVPDCKTSLAYSAAPNLWFLDSVLGNAATLGAAQLPVGDVGEFHLAIPISTATVQSWLEGSSLHQGVILRSMGKVPQNLLVWAQESASPPTLVVEVCSQN